MARNTNNALNSPDSVDYVLDTQDAPVANTKHFNNHMHTKAKKLLTVLTLLRTDQPKAAEKLLSKLVFKHDAPPVNGKKRKIVKNMWHAFADEE